MSDPRLIVALDHPQWEQARSLVDVLGDSVSFYKIGLTLLSRPQGIMLAEQLKLMGKKVFQDWKLHDIDVQVEGAMANIAAQNCADFVTIHGEPQVMDAAVKAKGTCKVLAVTVLTTLDDAMMRKMGYAFDVRVMVAKRIHQAIECGCDGVIASPQEAELARKIGGPDFLVVTPGVRPQGAGALGQARISTPKDALEAGASHLVIGRPITGAGDPVEAVEAILREIA